MKSFRRASAYIGLGLLVVLAILIYSNAQSLSDWWRLRGYDPPPAVSKLSKQDTMTDYARRIFYVNHPQLEANASQIRTDCGETEKTIILG
ncbi:MAG TPA: hypothetical protein VFW90_02225 [Candidatus Saccharimonadales bacterium]|nr:hypothetical protein [Candidatus Saccharimonadales bacterium]